MLSTIKAIISFAWLSLGHTSTRVHRYCDVSLSSFPSLFILSYRTVEGLFYYKSLNVFRSLPRFVIHPIFVPYIYLLSLATVCYSMNYVHSPFRLCQFNISIRLIPILTKCMFVLVVVLHHYISQGDVSFERFEEKLPMMRFGRFLERYGRNEVIVDYGTFLSDTLKRLKDLMYQKGSESRKETFPRLAI